MSSDTTPCGANGALTGSRSRGERSPCPVLPGVGVTGGPAGATAGLWPARRLVFVTDPHADPDALLGSLALAGTIRRLGPEPVAFELTGPGRAIRIVLGGDYLDKGPSDLGLLAALRQLRDLGADVVMLAGNHDLRALLALGELERPEGEAAVFLPRLGAKPVRLLREVYERHVAGGADPIPSRAEADERLLLARGWERAARERLVPSLGAVRVDAELASLRERHALTLETARAAGLSTPRLLAAARVARRLLLAPDGEHAWFARSLVAAHREGAMLYVHAGVDDLSAGLLADEGIAGVARRFRAEWSVDPVGLYHGPIGSLLRTKYRPRDGAFTLAGGRRLRRAGVRVVIHGHRSHPGCQQLRLRHGLLHVEADTTLDSPTRARRGLPGTGASAVLVEPGGAVLGVSSDVSGPVRLVDARQLGIGRSAGGLRGAAEGSGRPP